MYFAKIELHNYGIYKGTHVMSLRDRDGKKNITLVGGQNGRGKTTFHDAILIALYGKQALKYINEKARSYDRLLLEHINKHATDNNTYVAVTICLDDGIELRVKKEWQYNGKKVDQQTTVEKNGTEDKYLGENWSYYIEEILPFGIARFFFFNNEKITQLADDASFEQIKSSIKSAIGVTAIESAINHTEEVIKRKKTALKNFENSEANIAYHEVETQLNEIDKKIEEATRLANELQIKCEKIAITVELQEKKFWDCGGELSRNKDAIKQEMQKITEQVENIQEEIMQLTVDPSTPLYMCRSLVSDAYNGEVSTQDEEAQRNVEKRVSILYQEIVERLTACGLDNATVLRVKKVINDVLEGHIPARNNEPGAKNVSAMSMMLYEKLITTVFQTVDQKILYLVQNVDAQESELMSLDAHLGAADDKAVAMQLYEALKAIEKEKMTADSDYQRQLETIDSLKRQREVLHNKLVQLIKTIAEKENANDDNARIVRYAAMSIEVLTEFKTRLQREKVEALSEMTTVCFKQLVEKDTLISRVDINPDTLDVMILDGEGRELLKNQLSAGEQQMFAVSIVWALALTSGYKAPVIVDTPMARLDSSHRTNFVTKYLPEASSQVVVLSTDEEVNGRYLDLIRDNVVDYYLLKYNEEERCTAITRGYFDEVAL